MSHQTIGVSVTIDGAPGHLTLMHGGEGHLYADDDAGESGPFFLTDKFTEGHFIWKMYTGEETHPGSNEMRTVTKKVRLTKSATKKLLVELDDWQEQGFFDIEKALALR